MNTLLILHEGPYANERSYNGLRTGLQLLNQFKESTVNIYLFSDAVGCTIKNQKPSAAKYNAGDLIAELISKGAQVKLCKSCLDARGNAELINGVQVSNMVEYAEWIKASDKIISF
jgi:uncharacterized protein involved in oxidation of intracellular sulfur